MPRPTYKRVAYLALLLLILVSGIDYIRRVGGGTSESAAESIRSRTQREPPTGATPFLRDNKSVVVESCHQGDVWSLAKANDEPIKKLVECGMQRCRRAKCENEEPGKCEGSQGFGRCEDGHARGCVGNTPFDIDCTAKGKQCAIVPEGPACVRPPKDICSAESFVTHCKGTRLVQCNDGALESFDCRIAGGRCTQLLGTASCVRTMPPQPKECGECGCPDNRSAPDICGQLPLSNSPPGFEDASLIPGSQAETTQADAIAACEVIDVVAFVPETSKGDSSYSDLDIEREVGRMNQAFQSDDPDQPLSFHLADIVRFAEPNFQSVSDGNLGKLIRSPLLHPPREQFYIPILFADTLKHDDVPRSGVSTLPRGRCGDHPRGRFGDPVGLIVMAKRRSQTTGAHEVGHFLGLCHTHENDPDTAKLRIVDIDKKPLPQQCNEACRLSGDGLCDTPHDPGPPDCKTQGQGSDRCDVQCPSGDVPDPMNVMSYYGRCRDYFGEDQHKLMRKTVGLRRAWHRCLGESKCPCTPNVQNCPKQMSCFPAKDQPVQLDRFDQWSCQLDGPRIHGGICRNHHDCSEQSICVGETGRSTRCARICSSSDAGCECNADVGSTLRVCKNDLRPS